MPVSPNPDLSEPRHSPMLWVLGLITLALRSGSELTKLVGEIHHTATDRPLPWDRQHRPDIARAPKPYLFIKILLEQLATTIHGGVGQLPTNGVPHNLVRVRSALNGVVGDKLHDWHHPLTQPMEFVDEFGHKLCLASLQQKSPRGVVLFVHGLCLSEFDWQSPAHGRFVEQVRAEGFGVAWLRYNTGLPVWENGEQLANLIHQQWAGNPLGKQLRLVGHSMGGLIIRSAVFQSQHMLQHRWCDDLTHSAYLATPHDGAPLEKAGELANRLLGITPYSKPLMALGNIRSRGIRSLRYGWIHQPQDRQQHQSIFPFHQDSEHLLLAAKLYSDPTSAWVGDGLVPQASALGGPHFPSEHPKVTRVLVEDMGHIRLLQDQRTYDALSQWWGLNSGAL